MKKTIILGISFIIIGYLLGYFLFSNKIEMIKKIINKDAYFFLEEGIYYNKETLQNNIKNLTNKVVDKKKDKYIVYVGITKNKEIANRLKKIYEDKNIKIKIIEKYLSNKEFSNNVDQFDFLINSSNDKEEVLTIEEVVLANYEEIIKKNTIN